MRYRTLAALLLTLLVASRAAAQSAPPAPGEFLGYEIGSRFTPHHRIVDYFTRLDAASDLVTMRQIGETYEQRPLVLATITSAKNHASLDSIRRNIATLAAGEGNVEQLAAGTPAVVWLAFGVHGNESSSAEAAMLVASALVRDPELTKLLDDLVVIIDPLQNPDGRERYIEWFRRTRGVQPDPNADASEHFEPWPGGRFNHYLIDMNRDWAWLSQRETQARVDAYREWHPQVFVDFHEMSHESSYFFPPSANPLNENLPAGVRKWLDVFGRANAAEFSRRGWPFFVAEYFDLFYPGYGDSWPSLRGAIGMTYEMAGHGRAGIAVERKDGTVLRLSDRAHRHYVTAIATLRTAAENREALLRHTHAAARAQIEGANLSFLILPGSPNFRELVSLLQRQGIRVDMLSAPVTVRATPLTGTTVASRTFPAGTAVVSTRQPLGGLARTLLEKTPVLGKSFVEEQRLRAEADQPDQFYDVTTWSLPIAMNVEAWSTAAQIAGTTAFRRDATAAFRPATYGYLVDGLDPNVYRFVGSLLRTDVRFSVAEAELTIDERSFARGTVVILKGNNDENLDATLARLAQESGVTVAPLESGWSGGTALGSNRIRHVTKPKIGLVGGPGASPTSYGMLWHTLDVDTPVPHSTLNGETLRAIDLRDYDVLVFPDGSFADRLGTPGIEKLKGWINGGGTVVVIGGASAFLRAKDVEISKLKPWEPPKKKDEESEPAERRYHDFRVPGSAFRTTMNERSYLTFGVPRAPAVLIEGTRAYRPVAHKVDNIITVATEDPLIAGIAWEESLERIRGSIYLVSEPFGRGQVITFADDPHFRLFWRGTLPLFLNAVIYSPSFPR